MVDLRRRVVNAVPVLLLLFASAASAVSNRADVALPGAGVKVPHGHPAPTGTPPTNDDCANAIAINTIPYSNVLDNTNATLGSEPASVCTLTGATVWYRYTNPTGDLQILNANTYASAPLDTVLESFTGTCAALVPQTCSDDSAGGGDGYQSVISAQVQPGQTIYIRAGGFDGDTGQLALDVTDVITYTCPAITFDGVLGTGSATYPSTHGNQNERLNRNGIGSTCAVPKTCAVFAPGSFAYDAYTFANDSGDTQCVSLELEVLDQEGCNLQSNAYVNSFNPTSICSNYLADAGLSSGSPPTNTNMSFEIPSGDSIVVVVHALDDAGGQLGCNYRVTMLGNTCQQQSVLEIPTLDGWGLAALALLLAGGSLALLARRRRAA